MTTQLEAAARQALEALEKCDSALAEELAAWDIDPPLQHVLDASNACDPAITALRSALEQQAAQEPAFCIYCGGNDETPQEHCTDCERPIPTKDRIREIFMAHGFTVKEGHTDLKPYVYEAAYALLNEAPQQAAQEPACIQPTAILPAFLGAPKRKLNDLLARGYRINGFFNREAGRWRTSEAWVHQCRWTSRMVAGGIPAGSAGLPAAATGIPVRDD